MLDLLQKHLEDADGDWDELGVELSIKDGFDISGHLIAADEIGVAVRVNSRPRPPEDKRVTKTKNIADIEFVIWQQINKLKLINVSDFLEEDFTDGL